MPADGVHLAVLDDVEDEAGGELKALLAAPTLAAASRVGALFVDLPYYERFLTVLVAHAAGHAVSWSNWGDRLHHQSPVSLGQNLADRALALRRARATRDEGAWLSAFTLGYVCHAATDRALHPMINWLASQRPGEFSREHQQVEKLHSIMFHRERFGREILGTSDLHEYMSIDASALWRSPVLANALDAGLTEVHGEAPDAKQLRRWCKGYATYVRLLSGPLGNRVVTDAVLERERPLVYDAVAFPTRFSEALAFARRCVAAVFARWNEPRHAPLLTVLPEGTIDPPAQAPPGLGEPARP